MLARGGMVRTGWQEPKEGRPRFPFPDAATTLMPMHDRLGER